MSSIGKRHSDMSPVPPSHSSPRHPQSPGRPPPADIRSPRQNSRRASLPAHMFQQSPVRPETRERSDRAPLQTNSFAHPPPIRFPPRVDGGPSDKSEMTADATSSTSLLDTSGGTHRHPARGSLDSPRRSCTLPRPKLVERPCSTMYTTFPLRPPRTPGDEEAERGSEWKRWLMWTHTATAETERDVERGDSARRRTTEEQNDERYVDGPACARNREGLPKVSRACLVAEIKCYGKVSLLCTCAYSSANPSLRLAVHAATHRRFPRPRAVNRAVHIWTGGSR